MIVYIVAEATTVITFALDTCKYDTGDYGAHSDDSPPCRQSTPNLGKYIWRPLWGHSKTFLAATHTYG